MFGFTKTLIQEQLVMQHFHLLVGPLQLELKYGPNGERLIRHIRRVSSPGHRVYSRSALLRPVLGGLGISILSTSSGVVSDREARQRKLGGEVLCELW